MIRNYAGIIYKITCFVKVKCPAKMNFLQKQMHLYRGITENGRLSAVQNAFYAFGSCKKRTIPQDGPFDKSRIGFSAWSYSSSVCLV
jgi:hypothetical protein